jgi:D-glycero-beta-D-manno-heptose 1-phosphate adenylyltransferase
MITKDISEIKKVIEEANSTEKTVMVTNGCYDIVHAGHASFIDNAKKQCDVLIICLNSDKSVKAYKGENRPINNEDDRAYLLSKLDGVDHVYIFNDAKFDSTLEILKPKKYAKGQDYNIDKIEQSEREIIENYGGEIVFIDHPIKTSTTFIINKILEK